MAIELFGDVMSDINWLNETTSDPTVDDDITLGYVANSIWINTTTMNVFICCDPADGAAVWASIGGGVYKSLWLAAGAWAPRDTNGAVFQTEEYTTNDINLDQYLFDSTTEEGIQAQTSLPDEWDLGTIKAKVYWDAAAGASAADEVSWGVRAGALSNDDAIDQALGTQVVVDDVVIAVGDLQIAPTSGAITIAGTPALADMIVLQVVRNVAGNDDMTEDAKFIGMEIQWLEDRIAAAW